MHSSRRIHKMDIDAAGSETVRCSGCNLTFPSKNQLFRHLADSSKTCLSPEDYREYLTQVPTAKRYWEKIAVLYGYLPGTDFRFGCSTGPPCGVQGGQHAAWLVTQAIDRVTYGANYNEPSDWSEKSADPKINRSYGTTSRGTDAAEQDHHTGAITEVLCTMTTPLHGNKAENSRNKGGDKKLREWIDNVNQELKYILEKIVMSRKTSPDGRTANQWSVGSIQVFGRVHIPNKRFNAESDIVHRRVDYCFPADLLLPSSPEQGLNDEDEFFSQTAVSIQRFLDTLESFPPGNKSYRVFEVSQTAGSSDCNESTDSPAFFFKNDTMPSFSRPSDDTLKYLSRLKKLMQSFQTQVEELNSEDKGAMLEKSLNETKRKNQKAPKKKRSRGSTDDSRQQTKEGSDEKSDIETLEEDVFAEESIANSDVLGDATDLTAKVKRLLRRKRYHNFCPNVLAHDYLSYRRVDRFYHRGTIRLEDDPDSNNSEGERASTLSSKMIRNRPFFIFSLKGDILLHQQVVRVIGLLIAICRGVIHEDILECIFDEEFTHLVPAPPAPSIGLMAGEVSYITWEGRLKMILSARPSDRFPKGWNTEAVIQSVKEWEAGMIEDIAKGWYWDGIDDDGRLKSEVSWLENVLYPWAKRTRTMLEEYRRWKTASTTALLSLAIDTSIPSVYQKVLHYLRLADSSGMWPSTTSKRQLVMLSTSKDQSRITPLSVAHAATTNSRNQSSSAYSFNEGQGGASGSFSVGIMPDGGCSQPKGNVLFPELVRAAFELERALRPDRPPSSTIAINRNAQFRPHTDNGAGAGQSNSLIVGLGNYAGGELMVEGVKNDIRYNPIEFDGWKERHWTLPFKGERFSLVWFTPKGCEGKRGIDLYSENNA
eukprot:CCRYP_013762-RC/>CCRYP_013762-RC protein AED:0.15 eAED:0.15 QI:123/1/1/1/1/1/5/1764/877